MNTALVKDLAKQRQEYLEKKTEGKYRAISGGAIFIVFGLAAAASFIQGCIARTVEGVWFSLLISGSLSTISFSGFVFMCFGITTAKSLTKKSLKNIPPIIAREKGLAKKRREYLRKKTIGNSLTAVGTVILVIAILPAVCALIAAIVISASGGDWIVFPLVLIVIPLAAVFGGIVAFLCYQLICYSRKTVQVLVRVPPVAEQLAALAPEDILVRSSDQPAAAPGELLKAANRSTATAAEELLRPTGSEL